ncbi:MAG: hypothetical protein ACO1N7_06350 [Sphingobacteriaceae bacterium]
MYRTTLVLVLLWVIFMGASAQDVQPDSIKLNAPHQIAETKDALYYQQQAKRSEKPGQALDLLRKALSLSDAGQDENWVADVRVEMASALFKSGKSKQAFSELLTAEKIYSETGNRSSQGNVLSIMARFYEKNAAWKEAEGYYKTSLKIHESIENHSASATSALHLADLALIQNNLSEANKNISYAIKKYESLNDKTGLALSYVKLAEIYRRKKQYKKGEKLIIGSALPFFRSTGYQSGRIDCFDVLGKIYFSQKRYSEAKWFFIQANTQSRDLNDIDGITSSLINLGKVKVAIGDYNLAKRDFKEAQILATNRKNLFLMASVKEAYAGLYKKLGNASGSENATILSAELKDSLNNLYYAQAESARTARVEPILVLEKKKIAVIPVNKADDLLIVKIIGAALAILLIVFLILRMIK